MASARRWVLLLAGSILLPGVALAQVQAEMDAIAARQRERYEYHRAAGISVDVRFMHDDVVRHARPVLLSLFGAVGFVLLISLIVVISYFDIVRLIRGESLF